MQRLLGSSVGYEPAAGADFEAIAAVRGLEKEHLVADQAQDALHWGRDVLVEAVGELDHDDGTAAWRPHEPPCDDSPALAPKLAQNDIHKERD